MRPPLHRGIDFGRAVVDGSGLPCTLAGGINPTRSSSYQLSGGALPAGGHPALLLLPNIKSSRLPGQVRFHQTVRTFSSGVTVLLDLILTTQHGASLWVITTSSKHSCVTSKIP